MPDSAIAQRAMPVSDATRAAKPRILVVSEPGFAGVKRHVCHTLESLVDSEFEVAFVYSLGRQDQTFASEVESFQECGIHCIHVPMVREISPWRDFTSLLSIWKIIRSWKPDLVHCHSAKAGYLGRFAAKLNLNPPTTVYTPNAMPCYASNTYKRLEQIAGRWTDWLIAVTPSEKQDFINWRVATEDRIRVLPMAVTPKQVQPIRRADDSIVIGGCGRVSPQKRSLFFFEVGEALMKENPRVRLKWIGNLGNDMESHQVQAFLNRTDFRERIEITGWISNSDDHIAGLDVFCMFSRYESFGFVTADAMSLGVPVVALPATGTRDLVKHDETGLICGNTIASGHDVIRRLLTEDGLRDQLVNRARTFVSEHYSAEVSEKALHQLYSEFLSERQVGRIAGV